MCKTKAILFQNLWKFVLLSAILFWSILSWKIPKKITHVLLCVFLHLTKLARPQTNHKRRFRKEKQGRQKTNFVHSRSETYYALYPWVFWSEILTRHSLLCVLSFGWDLSLKFVPQDLSITLRLKGMFVCVWNCLICFFLWISICLTWNLSRFVSNSVEIPT